jgi:hypothetical protein
MGLLMPNLEEWVDISIRRPGRYPGNFVFMLQAIPRTPIDF